MEQKFITALSLNGADHHDTELARSARPEDVDQELGRDLWHVPETAHFQPFDQKGPKKGWD
jgi:hypothetical protein